MTIATPLFAVEKTRPIMWDMPVGLEVLWYFLVAISILVFAYGVIAPALHLRRARRDLLPPVKELPPRFLKTVGVVASQATVARRSYLVGWAHRGIFYGWVVLFLGTIIVALNHDFLEPIFGVGFLHGNFYLWFKTALNLLGTAFIAGLLAMMIRRGIVKPRRLDYSRPDRAPDEPQFDRRRYRIGDWFFVVSLLTIALTGFVLEGVRIAMESPGYGITQFGGWVIAQGFDAFNLSEGALGGIRHGLWWFHGLLAISVVAAIPYTKASHMFTDFISLMLKDPDAIRRVPAVPDSRADEPLGYATLADIDALHLVELDACTKCGKCHSVCPATAMGMPLSPRDAVLDLREMVHEKAPETPTVASIRPETAWSCMQCNACVDICPVGVQQAPIILAVRRHLVDEGEMASTLQSTLEMVHKKGNSFGERRKKRGSWTADLDFPVKDARKEPVDLLWFVGDYASFDPRSQRVTQALARILHAADVDFGILYDGESNAGNDVRRVGEEGLFRSLSAANTEVLSECRFHRILTTDPHTLNTLRNEYGAVADVSWTVVHHTSLLLELIEYGKLDFAKALDYRVTYHDPCHLGRMNGEFDAPREVMEKLGCELYEMPRNRENSFCCGAGGGRIWMPDTSGAERPSESRIHEAVELGDLDYFVVTCPKDVTMYEDAIRTTGNDERLQLRELTELVAEAIDANRKDPVLASGPAGTE